MKRGTKYIAKTPALLVTNIRNKQTTVVAIGTVSIKERGTDWRDSETFKTTEHQCEAEAPTLKEAMTIMWEKWQKFTAEVYGETIFCEQASPDWVLLEQ